MLLNWRWRCLIAFLLLPLEPSPCSLADFLGCADFPQPVALLQIVLNAIKAELFPAVYLTGSLFLLKECFSRFADKKPVRAGGWRLREEPLPFQPAPCLR